MLLALPIRTIDEVFKRKNARKMLQTLAEERVVSASFLASKAGVSVKAAWSFLKDLEKTGHVERNGDFKATDRIEEDYIVVNLRDALSEHLFKSRYAPLFLRSLIIMEGLPIRMVSESVQIPYRTAKRILSWLKNAGIILERGVRNDLIRRAVDPTDLIPRKEHRQAIRHFLHVMDLEYPHFTEPIVLFGDASWGRSTVSLDILAMSRLAIPYERHLLFSKRLVSAASNVSYQFGAIINLTFSLEDVWIAQKLGFVANPHPIISMAFDGICIHGNLPEKDDYYELMSQALRYSEERIHKLQEKGYITEKNGKYVYTEKAFESWRKREKSRLFEKELQIEGKTIRLIGIMHDYEKEKFS